MRGSNLVGTRFGRLVVLERVGSKNSNILWGCLCDCGNIHDAISRDLKNGRIKSCGCLRNETTGDRARTHGARFSRLYRIWAAMKYRCKSDKDTIARFYKNRGITVCEEWLDFKNFSNDMKNSYDNHVIQHGEKNTTLDRINGNIGYSKSNCRWATIEVQNNNQRPHLRINNCNMFNIMLKELFELIGEDPKIITEEQFNYVSDRIRMKYGKKRKLN